MSHPDDMHAADAGAPDQVDQADGGEALPVEAQLEQARSQAEEQRRKAETYLDLAQRSQADFLNYKRRTEQDRERLLKESNADLLTQLLPVLDDLQRAVASVPSDLAGNSWAHGISLIGQKLSQTLDRQGLELIGTEGESFDPHVHEAVAYQEHPSYGEGQVAQVYRAGYRLHDRVLRPAQVVVARGSAVSPFTPSSSIPFPSLGGEGQPRG
jgi:molecular chaperone GrpE